MANAVTHIVELAVDSGRTTRLRPGTWCERDRVAAAARDVRMEWELAASIVTVAAADRGALLIADSLRPDIYPLTPGRHCAAGVRSASGSAPASE